MITEVYEAFIAAGAPDDKAKAAAQSIADYENRFDRIDSDLKVVKAELAMVKWIVSGIGFGVLLLTIKSFL